MPTQHGNIWAQWVGYQYANDGIETYSIHPNNRKITAEAAISLYTITKKNHWTETGISQIVSNGVNETFDPPLPRIKRDNVTQITFRTASTKHARTFCRHIIYYWN